MTIKPDAFFFFFFFFFSFSQFAMANLSIYNSLLHTIILRRSEIMVKMGNILECQSYQMLVWEKKLQLNSLRHFEPGKWPGHSF